MAELELTRTRVDRRLYALEGVGTLRLEGLFSRAATAATAGESWRIATKGWGRRAEVTDARGAASGGFEPRTLRRGGIVRWGDRELELRPASSWRDRYALAEGDRELAVLDGRGWGRRPVQITIDDPSAIDAGLLLFAAFVVRGLAEDTGSTAAATSSVAATGG